MHGVVLKVVSDDAGTLSINCEVLSLIGSQKSFRLTVVTSRLPAYNVLCVVCSKRQIQTSNPAATHLDTNPGKCIVIHVHFAYKRKTLGTCMSVCMCVLVEFRDA